MTESEPQQGKPKPARYCLCILAGELLHQVTAMIEYPSLEAMLHRINLGGNFAIVDREVTNAGPRFEPAGGDVIATFDYSPIWAVRPVRASGHAKRGLGLRSTLLTPPLTLDELEMIIKVAFGEFAEHNPEALATAEYKP